jgi:DNA-binding transcriptional regulator YhcF (GntR family)
VRRSKSLRLDIVAPSEKVDLHESATEAIVMFRDISIPFYLARKTRCWNVWRDRGYAVLACPASGRVTVYPTVTVVWCRTGNRPVIYSRRKCVYQTTSGSRIRATVMQISLSKHSEVPLQQQVAEQIVFLITTGRLRSAQQLPSVRSLARRLKIHHNTVSKAYQDLVRRGWIKGKHGGRLYVGIEKLSRVGESQASLDELISESIQRAHQMGYSLQALREKVLERLFAAPPDHILVVEDELGLRQIIAAEICSRFGKHVETCSLSELAKTPELILGAQVVAPDYALELLNPLAPHNRPCIPLTFSGAEEHVAFIRGLREPSIIGLVSGSEALLKTARSFLASALGHRHVLREFQLSQESHVDVRGVDVAFCDSLAMPIVRYPNKIHYRLIASECMEDLLATFESPVAVKSELVDPNSLGRKRGRSHVVAARAK